MARCVRKIRYFSLFLALVLAGCATTYNPATEQREFILISTGQEVDMGEQIHQQIGQQYPLVSKGRHWERLQRIGSKLAPVSDRQDYQYHFYLIDKDELNAFTTPGGNIYFYTGLLDKLTTDAQVASVLAHEIGHCAARHTVKKFQAALGYNIIGSIVLSQIGGAAQQLASLSSNAVMQIVFSSYGRKDEYEADRLGVKYMHLAGYDLDGMIKTLEVLEAESHGSDVPLFLRSHPYLDDRITAVKEEIKKYSTE
jgi:predicted Zn-dependent protease